MRTASEKFGKKDWLCMAPPHKKFLRTATGNRHIFDACVDSTHYVVWVHVIQQTELLPTDSVSQSISQLMNIITAADAVASKPRCQNVTSHDDFTSV